MTADTAGARFCGSRVTFTRLSEGMTSFLSRLSSARHCRNRPAGLTIDDPRSTAYEGVHGLQVPSGTGRFPDRVEISTRDPEGTSASQAMEPQRAARPASYTSD